MLVIAWASKCCGCNLASCLECGVLGISTHLFFFFFLNFKLCFFFFFWWENVGNLNHGMHFHYFAFLLSCIIRSVSDLYFVY